MKNRIFKLIAIIGVVVAFSAISTMDYYTKELISDIPTYVYWMLFGGWSMMIPAFVNGLLEERKGGK